MKAPGTDDLLTDAQPSRSLQVSTSTDGYKPSAVLPHKLLKLSQPEVGIFYGAKSCFLEKLFCVLCLTEESTSKETKLGETENLPQMLSPWGQYETVWFSSLSCGAKDSMQTLALPSAQIAAAELNSQRERETFTQSIP